MRIYLIVLAALLVGCAKNDLEKENSALEDQVETLQAETEKQRARIAALHEQLENEAAEKVEFLKKAEAAEAANVPLQKLVDESARRVEEVEEMIKEVKKLE